MDIKIVIAFSFGVVFLTTCLVVALVQPKPTPLTVTVVKIILALAAAGVAALIPGFIETNLTAPGMAVSAGGAIGVFVLVFFFVPAGLVQSDTQDIPPSPSQDPQVAAEQWFRRIDTGDYRGAYDVAAPSTRANYDWPLFERLCLQQRETLGPVVRRFLAGANAATKLPDGRQGNYRLLTYQTEFSKSPNMSEVLVLQAGSQNWLVDDYNILPRKS